MVKYKLKNGNILKDGHTMFLQDVVSDLKRKAYLEDLKSKTDGGATVPCSDGLCETQLFEGDGLKILPESKEFRFKCCKCALIHRIEIEHDDEGVILRFFEEA